MSPFSATPNPEEPLSDAAGPSVGFGVEGALGPGAGIGVSWSIVGGMFEKARNAIPGFSLGATTGEEVSAALNAGYTHIVEKY